LALKEKPAPVKDRRIPQSGPRVRRAAQSRSLVPSYETRLSQGGVAASGVGQNFIICLLLAAVTLLIYFPVVRYPFVNYDDDAYVINNSHVNAGINWPNFRWAWTAMAAGNWHPLTWISHAVDCQVFGLHAGGHHLTSLLLHALNTLLLFLLLQRATGARWRSAAVAALFALHPLNVESVAWVAERKNLLCTFFFLLSLAAYGWYARNPQIKRYLSVAILFVLGLASKPMIITLPFVLLLVDFWPLGRIEGWSTPSQAFPVSRRRFSRLVLEKLPLLALSAASAVITIIAQRSADAVAPLAGWSASWRVENAVHAYAVYLWRVFLPRSFAPFYPGMVLPAWKIGLALAFLLAFGWLVYKLKSHRPYMVMGSLWFLGMLVPVIGLIQVGGQSMADRYTYIPCLGIFIAVVWGLSDAAQPGKLDRRWLVATTAIVLVALSLLTVRQVRYWRSSYDLWTRTLQVTVNNFVAEENLAESLVVLGRDDEALSHFSNAEQIQPESPTARLNLGTALLHHALYPEAIEHFDAVVLLTQDPSLLANAYQGLGVANARLGDRAKAREYFLKTVMFNRQNTPDLYNLSLLEVEDGIDKMSRSLSSHPTAQGYLQLGQLLQEDHQISEAQGSYEKALRLDPNLTEAKQALLQLRSAQP
jgi:tetratricopeptide (TPR) repeat protein